MTVDLSPITVFPGNTCYSLELLREEEVASISASFHVVENQISQLSPSTPALESNRFEQIVLSFGEGILCSLASGPVDEISLVFQSLREILSGSLEQVSLISQGDSLVISVRD